MMNKKKIIVIVVIVILIIAAILLWPKKKYVGETSALVPDNSGSGGSTGLGNSGSQSGGSATPSTTAANTSIFPLREGARGEEVRNIQKAINANNAFYGGLGYAQLTPDGVWGPKTSAALAKIFAADTNQISQARYNWIMAEYLANRPIQRIGDNFPLQLTSAGPRTKSVNIALGLFRENTTDPKAMYFTQQTRAALLAKHKRNTVDESLYGHLMEISNQNPGLMAAMPFLTGLKLLVP